MTVNIVRHDRGLDHRRIEKIVEMLENVANDFIYSHRNEPRKELEKKLRVEAIEYYKLTPHFKAIADLELEVKALEQQIDNVRELMKPHKIAIAEVFKGNSDTYNYDSLRDDSMAGKYIAERTPDYDAIKEQLKTLVADATEKLWLASNIDQASDLYYQTKSTIESIITNTYQPEPGN